MATVPKAHKKHKEKSLDVSLFDDNVDIFADLTTTSMSKKKVESKSIFDDDMGECFDRERKKKPEDISVSHYTYFTVGMAW